LRRCWDAVASGGASERLSPAPPPADDVHARAPGAAAAAAAPAADGKKRKRKQQQGGQQQQREREQRGRPAKDEEFGVTRGIDFKGVRTVINYDLPASVQGARRDAGRGWAGCRGRCGSALGAAVLRV
jgi:ATP-dependent RNA helicase DDX56/DBP9